MFSQSFSATYFKIDVCCTVHIWYPSAIQMPSPFIACIKYHQKKNVLIIKTRVVFPLLPKWNFNLKHHHNNFPFHCHHTQVQTHLLWEFARIYCAKYCTWYVQSVNKYTHILWIRNNNKLKKTTTNRHKNREANKRKF